MFAERGQGRLGEVVVDFEGLRKKAGVGQMIWK
jgi:hypothetical protein